MNALEHLWPRLVAKAERLSLKHLEQLIGEDRSFLGELVEAFCSELNECYLTPSEQVRPRMLRVAHTLKASAQYVGAFKLSKMAENLESEVLSGPWEKIKARWASFQEEAQTLATMLHGYQ